MIAGLSAEEALAVARTNVAASALSFAGSFFIVVCFLLFKELRKFSFRLVFYLSLCDMIWSLFNLMGDPGRRNFLCYVQGYGTQFFSVASFLWTTAIAFTLHRTVVRHKTDVEELGPIFHLYVWGTSLVMTVLPSVGTDYGEVGAWCWVQTKAGEVLRFISFYVPLWGAILFNGFIYFQVTRMLNYASRMAAGMLDRQRQVEIRTDLKIMNRLGYYPLILIGSWMCGTINRIQSFISPRRPIFWLCLLDVATASLMGLFNSIAYGLNAAVRRTLRERLQQYWPEKYKWSKSRALAESEMTPLSSSDQVSQL